MSTEEVTDGVPPVQRGESPVQRGESPVQRGESPVQREASPVQRGASPVHQEVQHVHVHHQEDVIAPIEPDIESGISSASASPHTQQLTSLQESAPGDWERAFAESPSLERSEGRGPADLEQTALPSPSSGIDRELWTHTEVVVSHHPPVSNDCPPSAGDSPIRVMARHHTVTLPENEDQIERAPQSTPRPDPEVRSPNRPGKRAWEGLASDMPSAKCLVRRLGTLMPLPRLSDPKLSEDRLEVAAQSLRQLLHAWKRLLGLTACAKLPEVTDRLAAKPSIARRSCPALWMMVFLLLGLGGVGLQWGRCQKVYLKHLAPDSKPDNDTANEYVCQHSFVWTYLLPRLIFLMGYVSVFVCWFCLKRADFITVVGEVYDTVTDQHEYPGICDKFVRYCRLDRRLLTGLFVMVAIMSAIGTLFGEGVVAGTTSGAAAARDKKHAGIVLAADVFNFVVTLVLDNVMFLGLVSHTLSLKYYDLILSKTQLHLGNIAGQAHISSDCYVKPQYMRGYRLMMQSQACVSAVLLMVLLRVCQAVTLILLDQSLKKPRTESLGLLPLVLAYTFAVVYHIWICCRLTANGRLHHVRHISTGPNFATGGTPDTDDPELEIDSAPLGPRVCRAGPSAPRPRRAADRTAAEWGTALEECPAISGRLFGVDAGPWMYGVLALVVVCYCVGYYAVERYWPLF